MQQSKLNEFYESFKGKSIKNDSKIEISPEMNESNNEPIEMHERNNDVAFIPDECTFHPKVNSPRPKIESYNASPHRIEVLSNTGRKDLSYNVDKKKEMELVNCTFVPSINKNVKTPNRKELYVDMKLELKKKEALKVERELANCTFKPKLNTRYQLRKGKASNENERLKESNEKVQTSENTSRRISKKTAKEVVSRLTAGKSIREIEKERALKKEQLELQGCSFKPKVYHTPKSLKKQGNIHERLYRENEAKKNMEMQREKQRQENEVAKCTFSPQIDDITRKAGDVSQQTDDASQQPNEALQQPDEASRQTDEALQQPKAKQSIFERLYEENKTKLANKKDYEIEKEQRLVKDCTFSPQIQPTSTTNTSTPSTPIQKRQSRPDTPIWERLSVSERKKRLAALEAKKIQLQLEGCSFAPKLNTDKTPPRSNNESIFERLAVPKSSPKFSKPHQISSQKQPATFQSTNNNNEEFSNSSKDQISHVNSEMSNKDYKKKDKNLLSEPTAQEIESKNLKNSKKEMNSKKEISLKEEINSKEEMNSKKEIISKTKMD